MDKMEEWEVVEFYNTLGYSGYFTYEQTRLLISTQVDHKKVHKLTDIMRFPWDAPDREAQYDKLTDEQKKQIRDNQRKWLQSVFEQRQKNTQTT